MANNQGSGEYLLLGLSKCELLVSNGETDQQEIYARDRKGGKKKSIDLRKGKAHLRMVVRLGAGDA